MKRLHTVLAATDLSAPSRHAVLRAAMLARLVKARLELIHVLEQDMLDQLRGLLGSDWEALQERVRSQATDALSKLIADVGDPLRSTAAQCLFEGTVLETIESQADKLDAGLVVVGARGAGFMRHWLLGATAERLLRKTLRPVLVVKQPPHVAYRTVLVPVDFSDWSKDSIDLARMLAPGAELVLLHVFEVPFEGKMRFAGVEDELIQRYRIAAREQANARLRDLAASAQIRTTQWRPLVIHGDAAPRILEQEEEQSADLIVLGKHGVGMVEELLLGSVTKHVLAQSRSDVVVACR